MFLFVRYCEGFGFDLNLFERIQDAFFASNSGRPNTVKCYHFIKRTIWIHVAYEKQENVDVFTIPMSALMDQLFHQIKKQNNSQTKSESRKLVLVFLALSTQAILSFWNRCFNVDDKLESYALTQGERPQDNLCKADQIEAIWKNNLDLICLTIWRSLVAFHCLLLHKG